MFKGKNYPYLAIAYPLIKAFPMMYLQIRLSCIIQAHPKFSLSFDALYRYSIRYATGIGLDLFYSSNMKELEAADRVLYSPEAIAASPGYAPLSVGIAVVQEVYW